MRPYYLLPILGLLLLCPVNAVPTTGSTIFFDDFTQSQLSPNWNVLQMSGSTPLGNLSQTNGWVTLTENRNTFVQSSFAPVATSFIASNIAPIISSQLTTTPAVQPSLDGNSANYTYNGGGSSTTVTVTTVANNYYFLFIQVETAINAAPLVSSISGSNDNGWSLRTSIFGNSNGIRLYEYVAVGKGGSDTVTIGLNTTCGAGGNNCVLLGEVFGVSGVSTLDGFGTSCVASGTSNSVFISDNPTKPVMLIGFTGTIGLTSSISAGVGYTFIFGPWNAGSGSFTTHASEYKKMNFGGGTDVLGFSYGSSVGSCLLGDSIDGTASQTALSNGSTGFFYTVWRMIPFNFSQIGSYNTGSSSVIRNAATVFGLFEQNATIASTQVPGFFGNGIGFELVETDTVTNNPGLALGGQKEAVSIVIGNPMYPGAGFVPGSKCFWSNLGGNMELGLPPFLCSSTNPSIVYSNANAPIDLNAVHVFTMEANLEVNGQSWAAFQVDDNAFMNVTQAACSCLEYGSPPGGYGSLYPYINSVYFASIASTTGQAKKAAVVPNQSLGTQIDYVLVADHLVTTLPAGQVIGSGVIPPTVLPQPGVTGSLPQFIQFEANSIAPGNLYAGGMMLFGIIGFTLFSVTGIIAKRNGVSLNTFGMFYSIMALGLSFFGFYCQVLPVMIPVTLAIVTFAITFGVIRTGQATGGIVPD